eukprot:TRINITY_DN267_c0_g2_i1.p1 TRINITY_DN267_c0_g2~~TRINITY_DN267_c0_g2_i1.p1  ORF type:complete len:238 (+),score=93.61 TRINITY_DN267_c0_g2_i1:34-714(+)
MSKPHVIVDIVSDILCPFCWVGKRALEKGVASLSEKVDVEVRWHPFFLRRGVPKQGIDKMMAYTEKFGAEQAKYFLLDTNSPVKVNGRQYGLDFNYKPGCVVGNSMDGHRLLWYTLAKHGSVVQNKLMEIIFRKYFAECENIGSHDMLVSAALEAGLTEAETVDFLKSDQYLSEVQRKDTTNGANGINSVPDFTIYSASSPSDKVHTSGAQSPDHFASIINRVAKL